MSLRERMLWNHNTFYHPVLLRRVPAGAQRVLDVGCGRGAFAATLARRVDQVDAMDRSPAMIADARHRVPANVRLLEADVLTTHLPAGHYDAITSITALHHIPLEPALRRLAEALKPGGILVAIALPRRDLPRQLPFDLAAALAQRVFVIGINILRLLPRYRTLLARDPSDSQMPVVLDPELTVREVRRAAESVLPGSSVRHLLFWRYLLVWHKPPS